MFRSILLLAALLLAAASTGFCQAKGANVDGLWQLNFTNLKADECGLGSDMLGKLKLKVTTNGEPVIGVYAREVKSQRAYFASIGYHGTNSKGSFFRVLSDTYSSGQYLITFGVEFINAKKGKATARRIVFIQDRYSSFTCTSVSEGKATK